MSKEFNLDRIMQSLKRVLPGRQAYYALHEPFFKGNEWAYLKECLDSRWVSSLGEYVPLFEKRLEEFIGIKHAIAVVNGSAALHIALLLLGVSPGEEVLIPALTFVATANAVRYCGAIPHFVDCETRTLGLDSFKLGEYLEQIAEIRNEGCFNKKSGRPIKAVIPMHTFGQPVDMEPLLEVCPRYRLKLIEDAAESLGSYYQGKHTGKMGQVSILSFNGNKIVTTGGGGAVITDDDYLARLARHLSTQAKLPHPWLYFHDRLGFNYRMPNINAALGCAQMEQLPGFIKQKRELAGRYQEAFADVFGVKVFKEADFARSNYWLNVLLLDEEYSGQRDNLLELTNSQGIMTRPAWTLMPELPMFKDCPHMDLAGAESLARRIINVPSSAFL